MGEVIEVRDAPGGSPLVARIHVIHHDPEAPGTLEVWDIAATEIETLPKLAVVLIPGPGRSACSAGTKHGALFGNIWNRPPLSQFYVRARLGDRTGRSA